MHSSERRAGRWPWLLLAATVASGCGNAPGHAPASPASVDCAAQGVTAREDLAALADLRRAAEGGPLYQALALRARPGSCRTSSKSGELSLEYAFRDGGSLVVTRNPAIEYSNFDVRFGSAFRDDPIDLLRRAERSAFSPAGCGIDWSAASPSASGEGASETGYYGDVCNCQARIRRDTAGLVIGLTFRSAC